MIDYKRGYNIQAGDNVLYTAIPFEIKINSTKLKDLGFNKYKLLNYLHFYNKAFLQ